MTKTEDARYLFDPYLEWAKGEGVPIIEDFGIDLIKVETKPWARFGTNGAMAHLKGRGDFISIFVSVNIAALNQATRHTGVCRFTAPTKN